jgi:ParB family chromosome partitioning protein
MPLKDEKTARSLLTRILEKGLSVREVERAVARLMSTGQGRKAGEAKSSPETRDLESRLTRKLGCRVRIHGSGKGGRLEIRYSDLDELNTLTEKILKT